MKNYNLKYMYNTNSKIKMETEEKGRLKLLGQGTYGCVFTPGISCSGMIDKEKSYITKVQKKTTTSKNEEHIGKQIQEIPRYKQYYAPIIETCKVDIGLIENKEIEKCEFIDRATKKGEPLEYEINKVPFVGNQTLSEYHYNQLTKSERVNKFIRKFINNHIRLLEAYVKLNEKGIVHFDTKENNIMYDSGSGRPKIIDFGMSFNINELNNENMKEVFFAYAPEYPIWCIEIHIISYMLNEVGKDMKKVEDILNMPLSKETLEVCVKDYIEKNKTIEKLSEEEKKRLNEDLITYISTIVKELGSGSNKWDLVLEEMKKTYKSWDIYALNMSFLRQYKDLNLVEYEEEVPFLKRYKTLIKKEIISVPNERKTGELMLKEINEEIGFITKKEMETINERLELDMKNTELQQVRKKAITKTLDNMKKSKGDILKFVDNMM